MLIVSLTHSVNTPWKMMHTIKDQRFTVDKNPDQITQANIWIRADLAKVIFSQRKEGQPVLHRTEELPTQLVFSVFETESYYLFIFLGKKNIIELDCCQDNFCV